MPDCRYGWRVDFVDGCVDERGSRLFSVDCNNSWLKYSININYFLDIKHWGNSEKGTRVLNVREYVIVNEEVRRFIKA